MRLLTATKTRHGFPPLYIPGGTSKLRFLERSTIFKNRSWEYSLSAGAYVETVSERMDFTSIAVIARLTGKADYSETISAADGSSNATVRTVVTNFLNTAFNARRGTTGSATTTGSLSKTEESWVSTMSGDNVISFEYTKDFYQYPDSEGVYFYWTQTKIQVELVGEYTDEDIIADIEDLLQNHITGSGYGLNGVADDTTVLIQWNENGVNAALSSAAWFDVNTLSGYTTPTDPATSITTYSKAAYESGLGSWWSNACAFVEDASMPNIAQTNNIWSIQSTTWYRFFVTEDVCGSFDTLTTALATGEWCRLGGSNGIYADVKQPHPESISNSNIRRAIGPGVFTSPGTLGSDCPCSAAP